MLNIPVQHGYSPQKEQANRLTAADRAFFGYEGVKTTVTGDNLTKVMQAVANGRKLADNIAAALDSTVDFYRGSERLASLPTCGDRSFVFDQTTHEDTTKRCKTSMKKAVRCALRFSHGRVTSR